MAISGIWTTRASSGESKSDAPERGPIVHVAHGALCSDPQRVVVELATTMAAPGRQIAAVLPNLASFDPLATRLSDGSVEVRRFGESTKPRSLVSGFVDFRELFREMRPRLVHFHVSRAPFSWEAILAARAAGVPAIIRTEHDSVPDPMPSTEPVKIQLVDSAVDHIVFVSRSVAEMRLGAGRGGIKNWSVIPNSIACEPMDQGNRARVRESLGLPPKAVIAAMVGPLDERRGPLDFLRAAAAAIRKGSALHFLIIGDGPLGAAAEKLARDMGIERRVRFVRGVSDLKLLLSACDLYANPGLGGEMPAAMVDAVATGLPVVTTAIEGLVDVLVDDGAFVCRAGDVYAMARGMTTLEKDEGLRARFTNKIQLRMQNRFSARNMHDAYEGLYRRLGAFPEWSEIPEPVPSSRTVAVV